MYRVFLHLTLFDNLYNFFDIARNCMERSWVVLHTWKMCYTKTLLGCRRLATVSRRLSEAQNWTFRLLVKVKVEMYVIKESWDIQDPPDYPPVAFRTLTRKSVADSVAFCTVTMTSTNGNKQIYQVRRTTSESSTELRWITKKLNRF
jgi:hypothetical protein